MPSFLSSIVPSFDFSDKNKEEKEKTTYTRGSDVEGWVFLAEETNSSNLTYADIAAGRKSSPEKAKEDTKTIKCPA